MMTDEQRNEEMKPRNLIMFGAPGTGKSYKLEADRKSKFADCYERVTFYPTYSYAQFVGTYKPVMKTVNERDDMGRLVSGPDGRPKALEGGLACFALLVRCDLVGSCSMV